VATFIALLGGNQLEIAVVHDLGSKPDGRLESLIHQKIIKDRQILNYAMFRDVSAPKPKAEARSPLGVRPPLPNRQQMSRI